MHTELCYKMTEEDIWEREVHSISFGMKEQPRGVYIVLFNFRIPGTGPLLRTSLINSYLCFGAVKNKALVPALDLWPLTSTWEPAQWARHWPCCPPVSCHQHLCLMPQPMPTIRHRRLCAACPLFSCDHLIHLTVSLMESSTSSSLWKANLTNEFKLIH